MFADYCCTLPCETCMVSFSLIPGKFMFSTPANAHQINILEVSDLVDRLDCLILVAYRMISNHFLATHSVTTQGHISSNPKLFD